MRLAAGALLLAGCASSLLLWPPKQQALSGGARRELIANGAIEVFVAGASEPQAYVLRFYGNGDAAYPAVAHEAAELAGLPIEIWGVNYPGYGQSRGKATLDGVAFAARTAYAEVAKRAGGKPIFVIGTSMGTTAALHLAATERVAGAVLHNPVPLRQLILRRHGWWNLWLAALPIALQIPDALDTIANARRAKAPALFISSGDDGVVPMGYQERIMKAYAGPWEMLEMRGAGHNAPLPPWVIAKLRATLAGWITLGP